MPIRRLRRATLAALCAPLLVGAGCSPGDTAARDPAQSRQHLISDELHNGGTQGFLFLPPMVPRPAQMGDFVPGATPMVRVDEVTPTGVTLRTLATFTTTTGPNRERIRIHLADHPCDPDDNDGDSDPTGYFYARWFTQNAHLSNAARYRVRVLVPAAGGGSREIGFADVDVVRTQQEFRTVDTVNFTPLRNGQVLRIKFRIDRPAVDADADGVFDWRDNCPAQANPTQTDTNRDGQGDACECVGVTCTTGDACHAPGVCSPADGLCSNPVAPSGTACPLAHATGACAAGDCAVTACAAGYGDCDGAAANGCETATATLTHCGACGVACTAGPHATPSCATGACALACDAGWADANGDRADGCERDVTTDTDCGAPGNACVSSAGQTSTCVSGACSTMACETGRANCNTAAGDGCEVNLTDDTAHCGACDHACVVANAAPACTEGRCGIAACNQGFASCDGVAANGCETRTVDDAAHCGACNHACALPNAAPVCVAGACAVGACAPGFVDLDRNPLNGCEVNLATDPNHCGAPDNRCALPNATAACTAGACVVATCTAGFADCDPGAAGCETDLAAVSSCGTCGAVCGTGPHATAACAPTGCTLVCEAGWRDCDGVATNGCEVDLTADANHCGACGTVCAADTTCQGGACSAPVCAAGTANCNGLGADGCETATDSDTAHCGACGTVCAFAHAPAQCLGGSCGFAVCEMGYGDCDGARANGCEVALNSLSHCGACGRACAVANGTPACVEGACAVAACNAGYALSNGACVDVNECLTDNGGCGANAVCTNTPGGRACACAAGFTGDGFTCTDVNECLTANGGCGANAVCTNTLGGRTCACTTGYTACAGVCRHLATDRNHCGACGVVCGSGLICHAGACVAPPSWSRTLPAGAPGTLAGRAYHTAIWTGTQMIVWGGQNGNDQTLGGTLFADGAIYTPSTDTWTYLPPGAPGAPSARFGHTALWTGSRMIVWGGVAAGGVPLSSSTPVTLGDGAAYDPATNTWTALAAGGAPAARYGHTAVWTGSRMIVWGGSSLHYSMSGGNITPRPSGLAGGMYDPTTDTWSAIPLGAPSAPSPNRINHTAVWTGSRMIVWGGHGSCAQLGDGGVFDPETGAWHYLPAGMTNAPGPRGQHTAHWTGTQMIVWGGGTYPNYADGGAYDPATNAWRYFPGGNYGGAYTPQPNEPSYRMLHTAVWTGTDLVVWGGQRYCGGCGPSMLCTSSQHIKGDGAALNLTTGSWAYVAAGTVRAPVARTAHTSVWTGSQMIVWGGRVSGACVGDGAMLTP